MEVRSGLIAASAWRTIRDNWRRLLILSFLPLAILIVVAQISDRVQLQMALASLESGATGQSITAQIGSFAMSLLMGLMLMALMVWHMVRIMRFHLLGEWAFGLASSAEISGTVSMVIYQILIWIWISLGWLVVGGVVLFSAVMLMGTTLPTMILIWTLGVGILYVLTRFMIAMPAVAVGLRPHIFRQMWPFGADAAWGVLGWSLLAGLAFMPLSLGLNWLVLGEAWPKPDPAILTQPDLLEAYLNRSLWLNSLSAILGLPVVWFATLLHAEAFRRLAALQGIWTVPEPEPEAHVPEIS